MASDLKIEIFAYNIFHIWWCANDQTKTKPDFLKMYGDECKKNDDYEEACDELFFVAICFRHTLFDKIYKVELTDEKVSSLKSTNDFYEYVRSTCDREDLFGHLTIFQRMFATLAFVVSFCFRMHQKGVHTVDFLKYAHLFWAMYFDKYSEEFYEKGGWSKLKKDAKLCIHLPEFAFYFNKDTSYIQVTKEACVNFCYFKNAVDYNERKQKYPNHISYQWIKFRIEHFEKYINTSLTCVFSMDAYSLEQLLEDLILILNPLASNPYDIETSKEENHSSTFPDEMSHSEIHCGTEEMNSNLDDDAKIQHLTYKHENRIIDKATDNFSPISTDIIEMSQSRGLSSTTEELILDIDSNGNQELYENTSKLEQLRQTSGVDATRISNTEHNDFPAVKMKRIPGTSVENLINVSDDRNTGQDEIANKNQVIYKCQKEETECHKTNYPRDIANSTLTKRSVNNFSGKVNPEQKLKTEAYSNAEKQRELLNTIDVTATRYIGASNFEKDLKSINKNVNSDDNREMIRKAQEDLKNEQEDSEVNNFLRLLLVLGVKEEAEFSMLKNKEETLQKSQENSNKQKKRSKKKTRK